MRMLACLLFTAGFCAEAALAEPTYRPRGFLRTGYSDHVVSPGVWKVKASAREFDESVAPALYRAAEIASSAGVERIRVTKQKVRRTTMTERGSGRTVSYSEATELTFRAVRSQADETACEMPQAERCMTLPVAGLLSRYGAQLAMPAAMPGRAAAAPAPVYTEAQAAMLRWAAADPMRRRARAPVAIPVAVPLAPVAMPARPAPRVTDASALSSYQQRLLAAQPVRGGDPKQGWTISD